MAHETLMFQMVRLGGGGLKGIRKATKACAYVAAWGIVCRSCGHDPDWNEYSDYWGQSRATTGREVQAFRECVPEGVTVAQVWRLVESQVPESCTTRDGAVAVAQCVAVL